MKASVWKIYILLLILLPGNKLLGQFQNSTFEQRKAAWLDRNGAALDGSYDTRTFFGRPYLFAWLEKKINNVNPGPDMNAFHNQLFEMLDVRGKAGCRTGLHISRIFLQYGQVLQQAHFKAPGPCH